MATLAINGGTPVKTTPWPTWPQWDDHERRHLLQVLESGNWSYDGPFDRECGQKFAEFSGAKYGWLVANGTVAIQLALESLDVGCGDEVIVPGMTWQATAAAVCDVNAAPILVDLDLDTYTISPAAIEAALTPQTAAIIAVHLYSRMADMDAVLAIAGKHGLAVVEDCAHQHGSQWRGRGAGSLGDVGAFSMQQSKVMTSGEGGAVITSREDLRDRLYALRNCGRPLREGAEVRQSGNYRVTEWQAAVLLAQLERLPEQADRRHANGQYLDSLLAGIEGVRPLAAQPAVTRQSYYMYMFRVDPEAFGGAPIDRLRAAIGAEIGAGVGGVYEALNHCSLYQPLNKKRHHLSPEYVERIRPSRFELPNVERSLRESCGFSHVLLLGSRADMEAIAEAVAKVQRHTEELME
jgi:L-glutamine:2-deoxy-scyllo-inosose/3-amino-2,3-dideoxy-scyllo-inosose aminotransferase